MSARILIVEDDADGLGALEILLRIKGYDVHTADGYQSAIEIAKKKQIDLVLCDIGLWDGDGCDLFLELKQKFGIDGIAVTAFGAEDDVHRFMEAGFRSHVPKPVDFSGLLRSIADVLAEKRALAAVSNVDSAGDYAPSL
jgi:DNA-binding response OmpR family regulator